MVKVYAPLASVTAPVFVLATSTLAPPSASPVFAVTRPLMTASCAASGMVIKHAIATNCGTRISCLCCEEESRWGRHFVEQRIGNPLGPRPLGGRDGTADVEGAARRGTSADIPFYLLLVVPLEGIDAGENPRHDVHGHRDLVLPAARAEHAARPGYRQ